MSDLFPPNRDAGLSQLAFFVPRAGSDYARLRNFDLDGHPHVSGLSPYIRRRLLSESEVLNAVLGAHAYQSAEKFVQEVFWRTYWKGWLELRPSVWSSYKADLNRAFDRLATEDGLRVRFEAACLGKTNIQYFNLWAQQLVNEGYLHNHARMWFASIWIFTLGLPWPLGADFFLRHLLDGDPASNTLSWRWVAGLQTVGKTYAARADNIAKYTNNRFLPAPDDLSPVAAPLEGMPHPPITPLVPLEPLEKDKRTGLLIHDDDLSIHVLIEAVGEGLPWIDVSTVDGHSPHPLSKLVKGFVCDAKADALARNKNGLGKRGPDRADAQDVVSWAKAQDLQQLALLYPTVGPARDFFEDLKGCCDAEQIRMVENRNDYDSICWPHATHGFFKFKAKIPKLLEGLEIPTS